jgi:hypothetical protein
MQSSRREETLLPSPRSAQGDTLTTEMKDVENIVPADFQISPIWEFVNDEGTHDETVVSPLMHVPTESMSNRFAGTRVTLANGQPVWAMIGNVDENDPYRTKHFISLSVYKNGWFHLGRYFDPWFKRLGPEAMASFLGLDENDVFPVHYDIRALVKGDPAALAGTINARPDEPLTDDQLIKLAVR